MDIMAFHGSWRGSMHTRVFIDMPAFHHGAALYRRAALLPVIRTCLCRNNVCAIARTALRGWPRQTQHPLTFVAAAVSYVRLHYHTTRRRFASQATRQRRRRGIAGVAFVSAAAQQQHRAASAAAYRHVSIALQASRNMATRAYLRGMALA
jgi:hypothetical protein